MTGEWDTSDHVYFDAIERLWAANGDLAYRAIADEATRIKQDRNVAAVAYLAMHNRYGGKDQLIAAAQQRASTTLHQIFLQDDPLPTYWEAVKLQPALLRLMVEGRGFAGIECEDLGEAVANMVCAVGSPEGVEMLHGLMAGDVAGRISPTPADRERWIKQAKEFS